jgi:hypothetical protein
MNMLPITVLTPSPSAWLPFTDGSQAMVTIGRWAR